MSKEMLSSAKAKAEFIRSIHKWLMRTLDENGNGQYKENFKIEGSSIMCDLPSNFFSAYDIPENTRIEMKFVSKK